MRKCILSLFIVAMAAFSVCSAQNYNYTYYNCDFSSVSNGQTIWYHITSATDHTVEVAPTRIRQNNGNLLLNTPQPQGALVIPETVVHGGVTYTVTALPADCYNMDNALTSVTLPNSITTIGERAFRNCTNLHSFTTGTGLTTIGSSAFQGVTDLYLTYNAANCTTHNNAFQGRLASLTIGDSVRSIPSYIFKNNTALNTIVIPDWVSDLGDEAFGSCGTLDSVYLGASISNTFRYCPLRYDTIRVLYYNIKKTNMHTSLWSYYDKNCLQKLIVGDSVTVIPDNMFSDFSGLTDVTFRGPVRTIRSNVFRNCTSLPNITLPSTLDSLGAYAFYGCRSLQAIDIPPLLTQIPTGAFHDCKSLSTIVIPDWVSDLGDEAFGSCGTLDSVYLGASISNTFRYCPLRYDTIRVLYYNIKKTNMHTSLWSYYDKNCLQKLIVGDSVTVIPDNMFSDFSGLDTIICEHAVPPTIYSNTFTRVNVNTPVWVPCGSIADYQAAPYWSNFTNYQCNAVTDTTIAAVCQGQGYEFYDSVFAEAGVYAVMVSGDRHVLVLTVNPSYSFSSEAAICEGETYTFLGTEYSTEGLYVDSLLTHHGCDSVYALALTVKPTFLTTLVAAICEGDSYSYNGNEYTVGDRYQFTFTASNGCDSVVRLGLGVFPTYHDTTSASICQGQAYTFGSQQLTSAGLFSQQMLSEAGCDSTVTVLLTVNPTYRDTMRALIFADESYDFAGNSLSLPGTYTQTMQSTLGCDSTLTLNLYVYGQDTCHFSVYDTTYTDITRYDTIVTNLTQYDTVVTNLTVYDTLTTQVFDTTFVTHDVFDTTFVTHDVFDTTFTNITLYDTVTTNVTLYDTVTTNLTVYDTTYTDITVYDTLVYTQTWYDTIITVRTVYDTVIVRRTIYDTNWTEITLFDTLYTTITLYDTLIFTDTITFEDLPYNTLTVASDNTAYGLAAGSGRFPEGQEVEIAAIPLEGYRFTGWDDGSTENPRTVTLTEDLTLMARFETVGVAEVIDPGFTVGTARGTIILYGAANRQVRLLDAQGRQLLLEHNLNEVKHYRVPSTGVYFLQVDGLPARKVIVME